MAIISLNSISDTSKNFFIGKVISKSVRYESFESSSSYLMEGWSPENNCFVYWKDSVINLLPSSTQPSSVVNNLTNKAIVKINT